MERKNKSWDLISSRSAGRVPGAASRVPGVAGRPLGAAGVALVRACGATAAARPAGQMEAAGAPAGNRSADTRDSSRLRQSALRMTTPEFSRSA